MQGNLSDILWQFVVVVLVMLAAAVGVWAGRRCRRRLALDPDGPPKWAGAAAWGLGLLVFAVLAVGLRFVLDRSAAS
jgi:hypothetical protein